MDKFTSHYLLFLSFLFLFISFESIRTDASHITKDDIFPGFSDIGDNTLNNPTPPPHSFPPPNYDQNYSPPPSSDIFHSSPQIPIVPPPADHALPDSPQLPVLTPPAAYYPLFGPPEFGGYPNGGNTIPNVGNTIPNGGNTIPNEGNVIPNGGNTFPNGGNTFGQGNNNGAFGQQGGFGGINDGYDYGSGFVNRRDFSEVLLVLIGVLFVFWV